MKITEHRCDIKGCDNTVPEDSGYIEQSIQVIFHTEQTEGRRSNPYLSKETLDICSAHKDLLLTGKYIHATGAQGNNTYYFKEPTATKEEE